MQRQIAEVVILWDVVQCLHSVLLLLQISCETLISATKLAANVFAWE